MDRYRTKECFSDVDVEGTLYKDELKILPGTTMTYQRQSTKSVSDENSQNKKERQKNREK